jgi:hypothetical protein
MFAEQGGIFAEQGGIFAEQGGIFANRRWYVCKMGGVFVTGYNLSL